MSVGGCLDAQLLGVAEDAPRGVAIGRPVTLVGSKPRSHLRLVTDDVSGTHALILNANGRLYVRDLASRAGTRVNGRRVREAPLSGGDVVTFGTHAFTVAVTANGAAQVALVAARPDPRPAALRPDEGPPIPLNPPLFVIGRRPGVDLVLEDKHISNAHAAVVRVDRAWLLIDFGSRGGTRVRGRTIQRCQIRAGDRIEIGTIAFVFEAPDELAEPAPPAVTAAMVVANNVDAPAAVAAPPAVGDLAAKPAPPPLPPPPTAPVAQTAPVIVIPPASPAAGPPQSTALIPPATAPAAEPPAPWPVHASAAGAPPLAAVPPVIEPAQRVSQPIDRPHVDVAADAGDAIDLIDFSEDPPAIEAPAALVLEEEQAATAPPSQDEPWSARPNAIGDQPQGSGDGHDRVTDLPDGARIGLAPVHPAGDAAGEETAAPTALIHAASSLVDPNDVLPSDHVATALRPAADGGGGLDTEGRDETSSQHELHRTLPAVPAATPPREDEFDNNDINAVLDGPDEPPELAMSDRPSVQAGDLTADARSTVREWGALAAAVADPNLLEAWGASRRADGAGSRPATAAPGQPQAGRRWWLYAVVAVVVLAILAAGTFLAWATFSGQAGGASTQPVAP